MRKFNEKMVNGEENKALINNIIVIKLAFFTLVSNTSRLTIVHFEEVLNFKERKSQEGKITNTGGYFECMIKLKNGISILHCSLLKTSTNCP